MSLNCKTNEKPERPLKAFTNKELVPEFKNRFEPVSLKETLFFDGNRCLKCAEKEW